MSDISELDSASGTGSRLSSRASSAELGATAGKSLKAAQNWADNSSELVEENESEHDEGKISAKSLKNLRSWLEETSTSELSDLPSEDEDETSEPLAKKRKSGQMSIDTFTKPAITIKLSKKSIDAANRLETKAGSSKSAKKRSAEKKTGTKKSGNKPTKNHGHKTAGGKKILTGADERPKAKTNAKSKDTAKPTSTKVKPKKPAHPNLKGQTSLIPHDPEDLPWASEEQLHKDPNVVPQPRDIENSPKVAMIIMFQAQFYSLFRGIPSLGPQDLEIALQSKELPFPVLQFMTRLMGLALNRKKPVDPDRYGGALEEIRDRLSSLGTGPNWPHHMNLKSKTAVIDLSWQDRLEFLYTLVLWALTYSESVKAILADINQKGHAQAGDEEQDVYAKDDDDAEMKRIMNFKASLEKNQLGKPVYPIGKDEAGLQYFLVKGRGLTPFRIYKQTNPRLREVNWISVASTVDDVQKLVEKLSTEQSGPASKLRSYLEDLILYLGCLEEERVKQERKLEKKRTLQQAADLVRAGDGAYVGRTRGRRINYNLDNYASIYEDGSSGDDYDDRQDAVGVRYRGPTRRSSRIREMKSESEEPDQDDSYDYAEDATSIDEEECEEGYEEEEPSKLVVLKYSPRWSVNQHVDVEVKGENGSWSEPVAEIETDEVVKNPDGSELGNSQSELSVVKQQDFAERTRSVEPAHLSPQLGQLDLPIPATPDSKSHEMSHITSSPAKLDTLQNQALTSH